MPVETLREKQSYHLARRRRLRRAKVLQEIQDEKRINDIREGRITLKTDKKPTMFVTCQLCGKKMKAGRTQSIHNRWCKPAKEQGIKPTFSDPEPEG